MQCPSLSRTLGLGYLLRTFLFLPASFPLVSLSLLRLRGAHFLPLLPFSAFFSFLPTGLPVSHPRRAAGLEAEARLRGGGGARPAGQARGAEPRKRGARAGAGPHDIKDEEPIRASALRRGRGPGSQNEALPRPLRTVVSLMLADSEYPRPRPRCQSAPNYVLRTFQFQTASSSSPGLSAPSENQDSSVDPQLFRPPSDKIQTDRLSILPSFALTVESRLTEHHFQSLEIKVQTSWLTSSAYSPSHRPFPVRWEGHTTDLFVQ